MAQRVFEKPSGYPTVCHTHCFPQDSAIPPDLLIDTCLVGHKYSEVQQDLRVTGFKIAAGWKNPEGLCLS